MISGMLHDIANVNGDDGSDKQSIHEPYDELL